ncbi:MAG: glycosyltransferase family 4 protein [Desulfobaccales bacterium]
MGEAVDQEIHLNGDWSLGFGAAQRQTQNQLRSALHELKPDVVHIIHPSAYYGANGNIHALPVIWREYPVVATFWGFNMGHGATWLTRALVLWLLWGSQALASHDFKLMADMRRLCLGMRQMHFLPVGSNILPSAAVLQASRPELRQRYNLDLDKQYIGYFGGFDQSMGVVDLCQAVRRLREDGHHRLRLLLIGWQRHRQNPRFLAMQQSIEREHIEDIVIMTPYAPDEEAAGLLRAADLVALPYRHNSLGRSSLMAALRAGAPVVLASSLDDLGCLNEAVVRVPPQNPTTLAQQIDSVLKDPQRAEVLGQSGRQVWEKNFSWPVIAKNHLEVYQTILKQ